MSGESDKRTLLIVEPQPAAVGLEGVLGAGWACERLRNPLDAMVRLTRGPADVLLIAEERLGQGPELPDEVRRVRPDTAVVVTTAAAVYLAGVDECVPLPCDPRHLAAAIERTCTLRRFSRRLSEVGEQTERLRQELASQSARNAVLETAWRQLSAAVNGANTLMRTALRTFSEIGRSGRLSLMLVSGNGARELRIAEAMGLSDDVVAETRLAMGEGVAGWVAQHGKALSGGVSGETVVPAPAEGRPATGPGRLEAPGGASQEAKELQELGSRGAYRGRAFLSLPLKVGDRVLGVINLTDREEDRPFTQEEMNRLELLADLTAVWLHHSRRLETAERLSLMDELTGLYNRRHFMETLAREMERAKRNKQSFSLAIVDLDHFKDYNDAHGHQSGDELLKQLAQLMQANLRTADTVCRYGGEEFAVILPRTGHESEYGDGAGAHFIDRLREVVARSPFPGLPEHPGGRVTISAGVAVFPDDGEDADSLIQVADERLYEAKRAGRNRVISASARRTRS